MQMGDIAEEIAEFLDPDSSREIRPELRFIPFAMSGAGDLYCFHLNAATDAGVPVVYMYHDANKATFKARKLQNFIFRSLLEAVAAAAVWGTLGSASPVPSGRCRAALRRTAVCTAPGR